MKRGILRFAVPAALSAALCVSVTSLPSRASGAEPCDNVTSIDFRNRSMEFPDRGTIRLERGVGFASDARHGGKSLDWKISLVQDEILRPVPSTTLRLLRFNENHITGRSSFDYVFMYQCLQGEPVRVFEKKYPNGVYVEIVRDSELVFLSGEWKVGDPACCPSNQKRSVYKWNPKDRKYVAAGNGDTRKKEAPN